MIAVGITGQSGFMGGHLYKYLGTKEDIQRIPFEDHYFEDEDSLNEFIKKCDVIIHLAAMNRHGNPQVIYDTNIKLVKLLISACEKTESKPHIIFSSSTQEERDNMYGISKYDGRKLLENRALESKSKFTGLIIPNVFGPFGNPYYNSVIATFSHQLINNETPEIKVDASLNLIYINDLTEVFYKFITCELSNNKYIVPHTSECTVSEILSLLNDYKESYYEGSIIPDISNPFHLALFNTFRSYIPENAFPREYVKHSDNRGSFVEILRGNSSGQFSYSTTKPGITRGNHYHTRKIERFAVIRGKAHINLRKLETDTKIQYELDGSAPKFVDIPVWYTHNIVNVGDEELITLFWINEPYNPEDPDTFYELV